MFDVAIVVSDAMRDIERRGAYFAALSAEWSKRAQSVDREA